MCLAIEEVLSSSLVPGDVVELSALRGQETFGCDALLLSGTCVVNEAVLSGESAAQIKYPMPFAAEGDAAFDPDDPLTRPHVLYCGTDLLQARVDSASAEQQPQPRSAGRESVFAIVIRTGTTLSLSFRISHSSESIVDSTRLD